MLVVRSNYLATCLLLTVTSAFAAAPPASVPGARSSAALAVVSVERIRPHFRTEPLEQVCRTEHRVYSCTDPVTDGFHCRCEQFADGWGIVADIHLEFVIHLADPLLLAHERLHIRDIETALPRALGALLATRFENADGCAAVANLISDPRYATAVLNGLATASNDARGCTLRGESKPKIRRRPVPWPSRSPAGD